MVTTLNTTLKNIEIKKEAKISVSITLDKELLEKIIEIKKRKKVEHLSPIINAMLWGWFK